MNRMTIVLPIIFSALNVFAAETPIDETTLKRAEFLAEEGDIGGALPVYFSVLRQSGKQDLANDAREHLERLGLTSQEIFKLDLSALKPEELDALHTRLQNSAAARRRQELDFEHARGLLNTSITFKKSVIGDISVQPLRKDMAKALDELIVVAVADHAGEHTREAQALLAKLGVTGPRVDEVQRVSREGNVSPDIEALVICNACVSRLEHFHDILEDKDENPEAAARRQVAKELGVGIYRYLKSTHAEAPQVKESSDLMAFWQSQTLPSRIDNK